MKKETFASVIDSFAFKYDIHTVFDDFLTMSICAVTRNPKTGLSHYEDLYLETVKKYKDDDLRFQFPKMFAALVDEMEDKVDSCTDVLGAYYEQQCAKKGMSQFFTPWPICEFMARSSIEESVKNQEGEGNKRPLRILEPACGSGRLLLAAAKAAGPHNEFYAIDLDHTCVKMTALNLFLNGVFHSEIMCGNFLLPDDFKLSYVISFLPIGIFRIDNKEESRLWHLLRNTLEARRKEEEAKQKEEREKAQAKVRDMKFPSESAESGLSKQASQITLF